MTPATVNTRYTPPIVMIIMALAGWWLLSWSFERYQASIGPEFIPKLFIKLFYFGCSLFLHRVAMWFQLPAVYEFMKRGRNGESEMDRVFHRAPGDVRIAPSLLASRLTYLAVVILLALAI